MTDKILEIINKSFSLKSIPTKEFESLKASGMKFHISSYNAADQIWVSVMRASGFFSLMNMDTLIITPYKIDMPLISYDRIIAMGNDTLIIEAYDTLLYNTNLIELDKINSRYSNLPKKEDTKHWYDYLKLDQSIAFKSKVKKHGPAFDRFSLDWITKYVELAKNAPLVDTKEKLEKTKLYSEGLLTNGGPATDVFIKSFGKEKTETIFRNVLFGTNSVGIK